MIDARAERERELTELIQADRPRLVSIYRAATGRTHDEEHPDLFTCAAMIRDILDVELPIGGA